jgi:hypothetical protein
MIIKGMTFAEIKKAVMHDYDLQLRPLINALHITYKRKWLLNNKKDCIETITYLTTTKNKWRIVVHCTKTSVHILPYLCIETNRGIAAVHITAELSPLAVMQFNTHFFQRFRERLKLTIEKTDELIKYFFKKNLYMIPSATELENGHVQVFTPLYGGVGLGVYHEKKDFFEVKTFVDFSLLRREQINEIINIQQDIIETMIQAFDKRHGRK